MSQDGLVNAEGRKLLNFYEKMGLTVFNGRTNGDEMGNMTFVGGRGSSVFDLVLKLEDEEEKIGKIEVIPRVESDRLPLAFEIYIREAREGRGPSANQGVRENEVVMER